jgi:hypothetical protein
MPSTLKIGPYTVPGCSFQWDGPASSLAYAASSTQDLALPRDGLVTDVLIALNPLQYDIATSTLTPNDDALIKAVNGLKLMADGGKNFWQFTDLRGLHYFNLADYGDALVPGSAATAVANGNKNRYSVVMHPGIYPMRWGPGRSRHISDLSAGIDAKSLATFQVEWSSPANSVMGTNSTISTSTALTAVVGRWYGIPDSIRKSAFATPSFTEEKFTIAATSSDLGTTYNLPTQRWIKRTLVMLTDNGTAGSTDKRDDTRITQIGVIKNGSTRILSLPWYTARLDTIAEYGWKVDSGNAQADVVTNDLPNTGIVVIEWSRFTGLAWGLPPITNLGDVQLGFTVGTGNGVYSVYNQSYTTVPAWEASRKANDPPASYVM